MRLWHLDRDGVCLLAITYCHWLGGGNCRHVAMLQLHWDTIMRDERKHSRVSFLFESKCTAEWLEVYQVAARCIFAVSVIVKCRKRVLNVSKSNLNSKIRTSFNIPTLEPCWCLIVLFCSLIYHYGLLMSSGPTFLKLLRTRSQAVARIADRTAKNCRGHVT